MVKLSFISNELKFTSVVKDKIAWMDKADGHVVIELNSKPNMKFSIGVFNPDDFGISVGATVTVEPLSFPDNGYLLSIADKKSTKSTSPTVKTTGNSPSRGFTPSGRNL